MVMLGRGKRSEVAKRRRGKRGKAMRKVKHSSSSSEGLKKIEPASEGETLNESPSRSGLNEGGAGKEVKGKGESGKRDTGGEDRT